MDSLQMNECRGFFADENGICRENCYYCDDEGRCGFCIKKEDETDADKR